MGKEIRHAGRRSGGHNGRPVGIERIDEFVGGFDEILADPALGDKVHDGEKQERLVRCTMVGDLRIPIPALVGPKIREHLEAFF